MNTEEQIKELKSLIEEIDIASLHSGADYCEILFYNTDLSLLKEIYESLNRLKDLEK